jgi:hypothetical protein
MKMEFGEFLAAPECSIMIITYPDIFRTEVGLKHGKFSREYQELSAVIVLDSGDMASGRRSLKKSIRGSGICLKVRGRMFSGQVRQRLWRRRLRYPRR